MMKEQNVDGNNNEMDIDTEDISKKQVDSATDETTTTTTTTTVIEGEPFTLPSYYQVIDFRGKGSYAVVCAAKDKLRNTMVAVKKNIGIFPKLGDYGEPVSESRSFIIQKRILREFLVLIHLKTHSLKGKDTPTYIVDLVDVVVPKDKKDLDSIYFIFELMETDLRSIISSKQMLSEDHVRFITYQILIAVHYFHSADILHRDIKPENILINSNCKLKIIDFGLARGMNYKENPKMSTNYVQTRWYRAPELLLKSEIVSPEVDLWSVGCILAELYLRKPMFRGSSPIDQIKKIIEVLGTPQDNDVVGSPEGKEYVKKHFAGLNTVDLQSLIPNASKDGLDLLKKLLHINPLKRLSPLEALQHPFFESIFEKENLVTCEKFDFSFEQEIQDRNTESVRSLLYEAMSKFANELHK